MLSDPVITMLVSIRVLPGQDVKATIRLDGVDTPEKRGVPKRKVPECERELARQATAFVKGVIDGATIHVDNIDLSAYVSRGKDDRGKLPSFLGNIIVDGKDLGQMLLDKGPAQVYSTDRQGVSWC